MFSPLEILYLVLAFCVLWLSAAIFWLIYQVAAILRSVNETFSKIQEAVDKIEDAVNAIRHKFESATSSIPLIATGIKKVVDYALDKKKNSASDEEK